MTKRKRSVLLSFTTMMLCLALVVGGSYALFSDQVALTTHLKAGTLDITLERTNLVTKALDRKTGFLTNAESDELVNFSRPNDRNVFDIESTDKIVPGCHYTATMKITNNTDVAFAYWVQVINKATGEITPALAEQLKVTVTAKDGTVIEGTVIDGLQVGSATDPINVLAIGDYESFDVSLEFLDLENNNLAKNQSLNFDIVVHAVQVTDAPQS